MAILLDTGILLRLVNVSDPLHTTIKDGIDTLATRQEALLITTQNIAELWNVATRPAANNGLNLSPAAISLLYQQAIEPFVTTLTERDTLPAEFRRLLEAYAVVGKQVHDTRLVAMMLTWQIPNLLTLNERNFRRFEPEGIMIVTPESLGPPVP